MVCVLHPSEASIQADLSGSCSTVHSVGIDASWDWKQTLAVLLVHMRRSLRRSLLNVVHSIDISDSDPT